MEEKVIDETKLDAGEKIIYEVKVADDEILRLISSNNGYFIDKKGYYVEKYNNNIEKKWYRQKCNDQKLFDDAYLKILNVIKKEQTEIENSAINCKKLSDENKELEQLLESDEILSIQKLIEELENKKQTNEANYISEVNKRIPIYKNDAQEEEKMHERKRLIDDYHNKIEKIINPKLSRLKEQMNNLIIKNMTIDNIKEKIEKNRLKIDTILEKEIKEKIENLPKYISILNQLHTNILSQSTQTAYYDPNSLEINKKITVIEKEIMQRFKNLQEIVDHYKPQKSQKMSKLSEMYRQNLDEYNKIQESNENVSIDENLNGITLKQIARKNKFKKIYGAIDKVKSNKISQKIASKFKKTKINKARQSIISWTDDLETVAANQRGSK